MICDLMNLSFVGLMFQVGIHSLVKRQHGVGKFIELPISQEELWFMFIYDLVLIYTSQALRLAAATYREYKESWEGLMRRGMTRNYSWENAAVQYEQVFQWVFMDPPYVSQTKHKPNQTELDRIRPDQTRPDLTNQMENVEPPLPFIENLWFSTFPHIKPCIYVTISII